MRYLTFAFVYVICLTTSLKMYSQVNLCGEKESYHPLDNQLYQIRDSLSISKVDTVIIYSHWIHSNGWNGYGKVQWRQNGETYSVRISFNKETSSIKRGEIKKLENDTAFHYFFDNRIDTIKANPDSQDQRISHDGRHFFQIIWNTESYCFILPNLLAQFNPNHKRVHLIHFFKEEGTDILIIDGNKAKKKNGKK